MEQPIVLAPGTPIVFNNNVGKTFCAICNPDLTYSIMPITDMQDPMGQEIIQQMLN